MEQELLTLPEHLNSSPVFSGVRVTRSLVLCVYYMCMFCRLLFVLFFCWPFCCLRYTDSDYPFGTFVYLQTLLNQIAILEWKLNANVFDINCPFEMEIQFNLKKNHACTSCADTYITCTGTFVHVYKKKGIIVNLPLILK